MINVHTFETNAELFMKSIYDLLLLGDRMGCGIDFDSEGDGNFVKVFFTKNGEQVGSSKRMKRPVHGLYPLFGTTSDVTDHKNYFVHDSNCIQYVQQWVAH